MSQRSKRVSEAIRREASVIIKDELKDPRIGFITVTKAAITEDLRSAVIYYSILGDEKIKEAAIAGLKSALPFIKKEIGKRINLRYAPDIKLKVDETLDYAEKIENIIKKIKNEKKG